MKNRIKDLEKLLVQLPPQKDSSVEAIHLVELLFEENKNDAFAVEQRSYYLENKKELDKRLLPLIGRAVEVDGSEYKLKPCVRLWFNSYRKQMQDAEEKKKAFNVVDFFCGAGGLSLGFKYQGFRLGLANDIQSTCINTYQLNHPEIPSQHIICGDIREVVDQIEDNKRYETTDVVIGGPPCQGFSMANRQRVIDDPRNKLYKNFVEAVDILRPKFVVMENVSGILKVKEQIYEDYRNIGYEVSARLLNAKDFGVPQNRKRVIFIANRLGIDNDELFEEIDLYCKNLKKTVLLDAIEGFPQIVPKRVKYAKEEFKESGFTFTYKQNIEYNEYSNRVNHGQQYDLILNHVARYNNDRDIEIFGRLLPGDDSSDPKIADIMPYSNRAGIFKDKYYKLKPNAICKTITAHMKYDCNMYIHPYQARGLSPREAARVQSYPDCYYFTGGYNNAYMQIGNSVPPLMSEVIALIIKRKLED